MPLDQASETTAKPASTRRRCSPSTAPSATSACAPDGNEQYLQIDGPVRPLPRRSLHAGRRRASRRPTTSRSPSSAAASPGSSPARGWSRPASPTCASSRRAATSAAPGTGTAIPARSATPPRWSTCRCSRRPATCRPRSTRTRRRSSSTASASASSTASTTTRCSTPRSTDLAWDDGALALDRSAPIAATRSPRSSSAWAPGRCTCRSCPASPASRRSRATRSTPAAGTTTTPAATRSGAPLDKLADKRVAIIGTGATAVQCVPHLAPRLQGALRLPAHAVVGRRARQRADRSGLVRRDRHAGLAAALAGELHRQPGRRLRRRGPGAGRLDRPRRAASAARSCSCRAEQMHAAEHAGARSRTPTSRRWRRSAPACDAIVEDRETAENAEGLVPPALQAALLPRRVPAGLQRSPARTSSTPTARASSASPRRASSSAGVEYEVDCIIYASGFEVGTAYTRRAGFDLIGRDGAEALRRTGPTACAPSTASTCTASRTSSSCSRRRART